ncbi:MAG: hypothetical protein IM653_09880, partial [Phenylobacterium sp.]|nr:hypothetical protein [Phenylobacterium sp.]
PDHGLQLRRGRPAETGGQSRPHHHPVRRRRHRRHGQWRPGHPGRRDPLQPRGRLADLNRRTLDAKGADVLVIINEWDQFRALDLECVRTLMCTPVLMDLRNIYKPADLRVLGFRYASVGRA